MNQNYFVLFFMLAMTTTLVACSDSNGQSDMVTSFSDFNSAKGIGKYQQVTLTHPPDESMVAEGKKIFEIKCASCHKLTDEKLVGPGLANVTSRRTPEWIMNFVTNTDEMIEKDETAQKLLEEFQTRMPNPGLSEQHARSVLEFMRKNDEKN